MYATWSVFGLNELLRMKFSLGCQLRSARGACETMTPLWSNLRARHLKIALMSATFDCSKRDVTVVSGSQAKLHTRVPIKTPTTCDKGLSFDRHSVTDMAIITLNGYTSLHTWYFHKIGTWEFDMSSSLKAVIKMKTISRHLQWILRWRSPDSSGATLIDGLLLLTRITKVLV